MTTSDQTDKPTDQGLLFDIVQKDTETLDSRELAAYSNYLLGALLGILDDAADPEVDERATAAIRSARKFASPQSDRNE